jgi:hypothetical protein
MNKEYNLHELKVLYKKEIDENKKLYIGQLIRNKVYKSQEKLFEPVQPPPERDLFVRMLAEAEGLRNMKLDEIEKPFDTQFDNKEKNIKYLGKRKDI